MKNDLLDIFGDELRKFAGLSRKQRLCVLYFCMSFGALLLSSSFIRYRNFSLC